MYRVLNRFMAAFYFFSHSLLPILISFRSSFPIAPVLFIPGQSATPTSYFTLSACQIKRRQSAPSMRLGIAAPASVCRMNSESADVTMAPLFAEETDKSLIQHKHLNTTTTEIWRIAKQIRRYHFVKWIVTSSVCWTYTKHVAAWIPGAQNLARSTSKRVSSNPCVGQFKG